MKTRTHKKTDAPSKADIPVATELPPDPLLPPKSEHKPLQAKITITRQHPDLAVGMLYKIAIEDETSGVRFVEVEMTAAAFAAALTGCSFMPANMEIHGLEHVGKNRFSMDVKAVLPGWIESHKREEAEEWLLETFGPPMKAQGWLVHGSLGSQRSITRDDAAKTTTAHFRLVAYADAEPHLDLSELSLELDK